MTVKEKLFIQIPFIICFVWITVAAIANAAVLLAGVGWDGFGLPQKAWTVIVLILGAAITAAVTIRNRVAAYGLMPMWAYIGILVRRKGSVTPNSTQKNNITKSRPRFAACRSFICRSTFF